MMIENYVCAIILLALGMYMLMVKKNLIQVVCGLGLLDYGVNLFIVSIGYNEGATAPLYIASELKYLGQEGAVYFVDPVPQALTLTSIVIGACVTAMSLALVIKLEEQYGTTDTREIRRLRG